MMTKQYSPREIADWLRGMKLHSVYADLYEAAAQAVERTPLAKHEDALNAVLGPPAEPSVTLGPGSGPFPAPADLPSVYSEPNGNDPRYAVTIKGDGGTYRSVEEWRQGSGCHLVRNGFSHKDDGLGHCIGCGVAVNRGAE